MPPADPVKEVKGLFRLSLMLNPQPAFALPRASINPFFFFFFFPLKLCPVFYFLIRFLRRKMNMMTWELSLQRSVYTTKSKEDLDGN